MMLLLLWLFTVCVSFPSAAFEYKLGDEVWSIGDLELGCISAGCAETSSHGACHWITEPSAVVCSHIPKSNGSTFVLVPERRPSL